MKNKKNKANKATDETKEYHVTIVVHYTTTIEASSLEEAEEMADTMSFVDMDDDIADVDVTEI
jgi:hypothetical protein